MSHMPSLRRMPSSITLLPISLRSDTFFPANTFNKIKIDDPVWTQYVDAARDFDPKMVEEWNRFLDVILVFIALFIGVLGSFVIETAKLFDTQAKDQQHSTIVYNALLFVSLALSIATAMVAMAAKLWLIQYIRWVRAPGSSYDLAMQRQKAYSGIQAWKLHRAIDSLPIWVLIAVFLFGEFIHKYIYDRNKMIGYFVGVILLIGLTFLVVASCSAAFISSAPFHSPFSHFVSWLFDLVWRDGWKSCRWRIIANGVLSAATGIMTILLVAYKGSPYQPLIFVPIVNFFAITAQPEEESKLSNKHSDKNHYKYSIEKPIKNPTERDSSPLYGSPELVLIAAFAVFIPMAVASFVASNKKIYIPLSSASLVFLAISSCCIRQLAPKVSSGMLEAEAIAWLLQSSRDPEPLLFEKASGVATTTPRKVLFLSKTTLSLLPHMIASLLGHTSGERENGELHTLLSCLQHLSDFHDTEWSIWRNSAALKHPELPLALHNQLEQLRSNADPRLSAAAEAILSHDWSGKKIGRRICWIISHKRGALISD